LPGREVILMSFKQWIAQYSTSNRPIGDLAKDISVDDHFPEEDDYKKILDHLNNLRACDGAINTFKRAWRKYRSLDHL
jgi:uncharacterized protein YozE (UPF0346 family)